jgi:hypothetical protein
MKGGRSDKTTFQGKGAESIRTKKQLQRLADDYGISFSTRFWGSVRVQVRKGVDERVRAM